MRKKMISLMMTVAMGTVMISGATVVKADSDEKETVKLAVWSSGAADNFQKGADEFNKRQDKINFVVEMQSGDYSQYLGAKVVMISVSISETCSVSPLNLSLSILNKL